MLVLLLLLTADVHADIDNGQAAFDSKTLEDIADIVIKKTGIGENLLVKLGALEDIVEAQGLQIVSLQHEIGSLQDIIREQAKEAVSSNNLVSFKANQQEEVNLSIHNRTSEITNMKETLNRTHAPSMYRLTTDTNKQKPHLQTSFDQEETKELIGKKTPNSNEGQMFLNQNTELDFRISEKEVSMRLQKDRKSGDDMKSNLSLTTIAKNIPPYGITNTENEARILKNGRQQRALSSEHIAFSAYLGSTTDHYMTGHVVKCDQVLLNDGQAYNTYTGIFTVPETGVYLLTFSITTDLLDHWMTVQMIVNNRMIVEASIDTKYVQHSEMGGNTVIVRLNQGESVWLQISDSSNGKLFGGTRRDTTFSGVLLY